MGSAKNSLELKSNKQQWMLVELIFKLNLPLLIRNVEFGGDQSHHSCLGHCHNIWPGHSTLEDWEACGPKQQETPAGHLTAPLLWGRGSPSHSLGSHGGRVHRN